MTPWFCVVYIKVMNFLSKNFKKGDMQKGQAMIISVIFFLFISFATSIGLVGSTVREYKVTNDELIDSKRSFYLSESGVEDVLYRLRKGMSYSNTEYFMLSSNWVDTTVTDTSATTKTIEGLGTAFYRNRKTELRITGGGESSFSSPVHVGEGGVSLENTSSLGGDVFSNGPVVGQNNNVIAGDVVSTGASGSVSVVHASSDVHSHSISNSTIDGDAYYQSISGTTVGGTSFSGSSDVSAVPLPIDDATITAWEAEAEAGGVTGTPPCTQEYRSGSQPLGPIKILCDVLLTGGPIVLRGPVWIVGNLTISESGYGYPSSFELDGASPEGTIPVIVDDPSNRTTGSKIVMSDSETFTGNGPKEYPLLISMNNSAESSGSEDAITITGSPDGDFLVYAPHGKISLENDMSIKLASGYKVVTKNNAVIDYVAGSLSVLFGSGSDWVVNYWKEVK